MKITMQRTVVELGGKSFCVCTERDIRGEATRWAIGLGGWLSGPGVMAASVLDATRAGVMAVLAQAVGLPTGIRSEVSCEMLSSREVEQLIAEIIGQCAIEEF